MPEYLSPLNKNLLLIANLFIGTSTVIILKGQSKCKATVDGTTQDYQHPFMQVFTMYIGEALCIFIFMINNKRNKLKIIEQKQKAVEDGKKPKINPLLLAIPCFGDFVTSSLGFFALQMIPPSVYSMVRGGNVIVTAIFSVIFLKSKLYRQNILGMTLLVIGLVIVGLVEIVGDNDSDDDDHNSANIIVGIILLVTSFFSYSSQVIIEQKFFSKYFLDSFQVVGFEGLWGIIISGISVVILQQIPCTDSMKCSENEHGKKYLEDGKLFFQQVFSFSDQPNQPALILLIFFGIISILFFNVLQTSVTKYISSLTRNVLQVTVPLFVWVTSLVLGWEKFMWGQLGGFVIMTIGSLVYNEIIVLPFWGFNKNLKTKTIVKLSSIEQEDKKSVSDLNQKLLLQENTTTGDEITEEDECIKQERKQSLKQM